MPSSLSPSRPITSATWWGYMVIAIGFLVTGQAFTMFGLQGAAMLDGLLTSPTAVWSHFRQPVLLASAQVGVGLVVCFGIAARARRRDAPGLARVVAAWLPLAAAPTLAAYLLDAGPSARGAGFYLLYFGASLAVLCVPVIQAANRRRIIAASFF